MDNIITKQPLSGQEMKEQGLTITEIMKEVIRYKLKINQTFQAHLTQRFVVTRLNIIPKIF